MIKFEQIKDESEEGFRRLTGIKRTTFASMLSILRKAEVVMKARGGKPNKLALEERLLMALEYLREYRTYFHISRSYGISESACYRNIRCVEDILIDLLHNLFWLVILLSNLVFVPKQRRVRCGTRLRFF